MQTGCSGTNGMEMAFPGGPRLHRVFDAVGTTSWPALGFRAESGGPLFATRMLASLLVHAYSQGLVASEEIAEACRTEADARYLCSGDVPDARVLRRFRRHHSEALIDALSRFWSDSGGVAQSETLERARQRLDAAVAADSLALDF